jgi:ABC-2 type transport system permease protein
VTAFLIMSLPGLLFALVVGTIWLGVPIRPHPLLPLALILGSVSLSVTGALVGVYSRTQESANLTVNLLTLGLTVLSPVLAPIERLPRLLQWTSRFVPTTYATAAVRSALVSQLDAQFWLNLAVLALFCVLALIVVNRHLDWRA